MRIIKDTQIDFMSKSKIAGFLSGTIILVGIISLVINKGPNLSIDFKGGSMVAVNYTEPVDINEVRSALSNVSIDGQNFDFSQTEIKHFGDESNVAVRLPTLEHEPEQFSQKFVANMKNIFPDYRPGPYR